jgi:large subunit ribosomal protein L10
MVTLEQKKIIVEELVDKFKKAQGVYFVNFQTMTVAEVQDFRKAVKEKELEYKVAKNTLIKRAMNEVGGYEIPDEMLFGATGVVFTYDDPTTPAKIIKKFVDDIKKPEFKGAQLDGQLFNNTQLKTVADLPSKEDMFAAIVGSVGAPASGIVGSIAALMRDIASMVEEVAKKKEAA